MRAPRAGTYLCLSRGYIFWFSDDAVIVPCYYTPFCAAAAVVAFFRVNDDVAVQPYGMLRTCLQADAALRAERSPQYLLDRVLEKPACLFFVPARA